jgi:RNA polymerase sigma-70 factor (ECF subfamily)
MAKHDYAGALSVAPDMPGDAEMPAVCAHRPVAGSREPAPVLSLVAGLGHKLSKASRDRRIVSARRSIETKAAETQSGDAIDRTLMARVVARDAQAFAELSERHATAALGLAHRIVRNSADAEDVVQESLTRLWIFADRWNPDAARFSSWFYRIVSNQAISRLRRKTTESIDTIAEPPDSTPGPHDQLAGREIGKAIVQAIARLPERQRTAIALCYDQGLSCAEAAVSMDVSIGTMESLLFRARRSLREWLSGLSSDLEEQ